MVMAGSLEAKLIPEFVRAWAVLEERKRILQGKALPGEELRATTTGMAMHALTGRRARTLPGFRFTPPALVDATPLAQMTPAGTHGTKTPEVPTMGKGKVDACQVTNTGDTTPSVQPVVYRPEAPDPLIPQSPEVPKAEQVTRTPDRT